MLLDNLSQGSDKWRALVNAVMNLLVPYNAGNFLTSWRNVYLLRKDYCLLCYLGSSLVSWFVISCTFFGVLKAKLFAAQRLLVNTLHNWYVRHERLIISYLMIKLTCKFQRRLSVITRLCTFQTLPNRGKCTQMYTSPLWTTEHTAGR